MKKLVWMRIFITGILAVGSEGPITNVNASSSTEDESELGRSFAHLSIDNEAGETTQDLKNKKEDKFNQLIHRSYDRSFITHFIEVIPSQKRLAEIVGLAQSTVSRIKNVSTYGTQEKSAKRIWKWLNTQDVKTIKTSLGLTDRNIEFIIKRLETLYPIERDSNYALLIDYNKASSAKYTMKLDRLKEEYNQSTYYFWDPRKKVEFSESSSKELGKIFKDYMPHSVSITEEQIYKANKVFKKLKQSIKSVSHEDLKKFAKIGYPVAQYLLAKQIGVSDIPKSKQLIFQAAAQRYPKALYELSFAYDTGPELFDLEQNSHISELLCKEAAILGDPKANFDLALAPISKLYPSEFSKEEAMSKIDQLASEGNPFAQEFIEDINDVGSDD